MAGGGDGYPFPSFPTTNRVDTGIGEQKALQDFLTANFNQTPYNIPDVGVAQDTRIQNLAARSDRVIAGISRAFTRAADILTGDIGNAPHPPDTDILTAGGVKASTWEKSPLSFLPISAPASMSAGGAFNFDLMGMGNRDGDAIASLLFNQPTIF